jgi:hypothetical protein
MKNFKCYHNNCNCYAEDYENNCYKYMRVENCPYSLLESLNKEKYKVAKPFSLFDIASKNPCMDKFLDLCTELKAARIKNNAPSHQSIAAQFNESSKISNYPTLLQNLDWMNEHFPGAIVKAETETKLLPGMRVKSDYGKIFLITQNQDFVCVDNGDLLECAKGSKTLEELNLHYPLVNFKIAKKGENND